MQKHSILNLIEDIENLQKAESKSQILKYQLLNNLDYLADDIFTNPEDFKTVIKSIIADDTDHQMTYVKILERLRSKIGIEKVKDIQNMLNKETLLIISEKNS